VLEAKTLAEGYGTLSRVARQLRTWPETLRHWAAKAEVDEGLGLAYRPGSELGPPSSSGTTFASADLVYGILLPSAGLEGEGGAS